VDSSNPTRIQVLEASTCHISPRDALLLKECAENEGGVTAVNNTLIIHEYTEGCDIYVSEEIYDKEYQEALLNDDYSQAFVDLLKLAKKFGCTYLKLDRDGTEYDDLPQFTW
jgi:hypothetical protein